MKKRKITLMLMGWLFLGSRLICLPTAASAIDAIIENTTPLNHEIGERLPLYVWTSLPAGSTPEAIRKQLKDLQERGIAVFTPWRPAGGDVRRGIEEALQVDKIKAELGLRINVNATALAYGFFTGSADTAHVNADGTPFFDSGTGYRRTGCPFTVEKRYSIVKSAIERFLESYREEGLAVDLWALDWERDGPLEWNIKVVYDPVDTRVVKPWENSKNCVRCRDHIDGIEKFGNFQEALRRVRAQVQKDVFSDTVKRYFPKAITGNYGVNPHNGYRYWWDWWEKTVEGMDDESVGRGPYRRWFDEFALTGYSAAMPVIYARYHKYHDYTFDDVEYRWFYGMLKEASSCAENTPQGIVVIPFVHRQVVDHLLHWSIMDGPLPPDGEAPDDLVSLSHAIYEDLLWHMLLRGIDTFCLWSPGGRMAAEIAAVHDVYAQSFQYNDFMLDGRPVVFDVPDTPAVIVSALKLNEKLLIRRTDFDRRQEPAVVQVEGRAVVIPYFSGMQVFDVRDIRLKEGAHSTSAGSVAE